MDDGNYLVAIASNQIASTGGLMYWSKTDTAYNRTTIVNCQVRAKAVNANFTGAYTIPLLLIPV